MEASDPVVPPHFACVSRSTYGRWRLHRGVRAALGLLPPLVSALLLCAAGVACLPAHRADAQSCVGDCNRDATVAVTELIKGVGMAMGDEPIDACPAFDATEDRLVTVDELVVAVRYALNGCAGLPLEVLDSRQVFATHIPHGTGNANVHAPDTAGVQHTLVIVATLNYSARANFHDDEQGNSRILWDLTPEEFRNDVLWTLKGRPDTPTPHRSAYDEFFAAPQPGCASYYAHEHDTLVTHAHATGCSLSQDLHHLSQGQTWIDGAIVGPVQIPYDGDYYGWASSTWGDPVALAGYLEIAAKAVDFLHRPSRLAVEKQASGIDCGDIDCSTDARTVYHWDREVLTYSTDSGEWTIRGLGAEHPWLVPIARPFRRMYVLLYNEAPSAQARKAAAGQASGPQSAVYLYPREDPSVRLYGSTFGSYGAGMGAVLHDFAHGLGGNLPSEGVLNLLRQSAPGQPSGTGGGTIPPVSWIVDREQANTFSPQDGSFYIRYDLKLNECVTEHGLTTGCESLPMWKFGYVCKHTHFEAGPQGGSRTKGICVPACPDGNAGSDACATYYGTHGGIIPASAYSCTPVNHAGQRGCSLARFQPVSAETNLPGAATHVDSGWKWCRPSCVQAGTDSALGNRICEKGFGRKGWTCRSPEPSDTVVQGADRLAAFAHCSDGVRTLCCFPPRQESEATYEGDPLWCRNAPEDRLFEAFDYQHALSLMGDRRVDDYYDIPSGYRPAYQGYDYLPRQATFEPFGSIYHSVYMGPLDIMSQHNFSPAATDFVGELTASTRFNIGWYPRSAVAEFTVQGVERCLGGTPSLPDQSYSFTLRPWDYAQYCSAHPASCGGAPADAPSAARFLIADDVAIYIEDARRWGNKWTAAAAGTAGYLPPAEHGILATFVDRREYYLRGRGRVIDLGDSLTEYPSTSPAFEPPAGSGCTPGGSKGCPMFPRAGTLLYTPNGRLAELDLDPGLGITQNDRRHLSAVTQPLCAGGFCAPAYEDYLAEHGRVTWRRCGTDDDCVERYSTPRLHIPGLDIFEIDGDDGYGPYDCARSAVRSESDLTCGAPGGCACDADNDLYAHAFLSNTAGTFWPASEDRYYMIIFPGLGEQAVGPACVGMKLRVDCEGGTYAESCAVDVRLRTFR